MKRVTVVRYRQGSGAAAPYIVRRTTFDVPEGKPPKPVAVEERTFPTLADAKQYVESLRFPPAVPPHA